jgi:hypothetical protein
MEFAFLTVQARAITVVFNWLRTNVANVQNSRRVLNRNRVSIDLCELHNGDVEILASLRPVVDELNQWTGSCVGEDARSCAFKVRVMARVKRGTLGVARSN